MRSRRVRGISPELMLLLWTVLTEYFIIDVIIIDIYSYH